jgi:hypothetical protein
MSSLNAATCALGQAESTIQLEGFAGVDVTQRSGSGEIARIYFDRRQLLCQSLCIAHYFNDDLELSNPENLHCLMPGTLIRHMGKHLLFIRTKIAPNHPDFVNCVNEDTFPVWYTSVRAEFENACECFQLLHQGDEIFAGHNIHALYRHTTNDKTGKFLDAKCDLRLVMLSLYKKATPRNQMMVQAA